MPVYLKSDNEIIQKYENVSITQEHSYYETTKDSASNGSWYFEVTHKSGNSLSLVGFCDTKQNQIAITRSMNSDYFKIYYVINLNNTDLFLDNITVPNVTYTLGVGIDIDKRLFYIQYNKNDINVVNFPDDMPYDLKWSPMVRAMGIDTTTNLYDINFGYTDFEYGAPFGCLSWRKTVNSFTCENNRIETSFLRYCAISLIMR